VLNYLITIPWRLMREYRYSFTILDFGTGWRLVVSFTLLSLYSLGVSPRYRLDRRLGGPQRRSGFCGEEKCCPAGNRTRAVQPVARRYTE
jgi:hypothetical protein